MNVTSIWWFMIQKLKLVRLEEISRYFVFGILSLVDLLWLTSWTIGVGSGGLNSETLGISFLLSSFLGGLLGHTCVTLWTDHWYSLKTNFGALLALWFWTLTLPALFIVLLALENIFHILLWHCCTIDFGRLFTTGWGLTGFGSFCITGVCFGAVTINFTFSPFGTLGTILVGIAACLRCSLFHLFSPCGVCHNIRSESLSIGLDHTLFPFLCQVFIYPYWLGG